MTRTHALHRGRYWLAALAALVLAGCETVPVEVAPAFREEPQAYEYKIGPGDSLNIFVWRNPEVSPGSIIVRPDGKFSTPLVEDLVAAGKTPTQLAREVEQVLSQYIKEPLVTVMPGGFVGLYSEQVRVVGEAPWVSRIAGRHHAEVGGFTLSADGRRLVVVSTLDNLLKGAATQAVQNLNLAFGFDELAGIPLEDAA